MGPVHPCLDLATSPAGATAARSFRSWWCGA